MHRLNIKNVAIMCFLHRLESRYKIVGDLHRPEFRCSSKNKIEYVMLYRTLDDECYVDFNENIWEWDV